jgi:hypothetical protein
MSFLRQLIRKPLSSASLATILAIPAIREQEIDLEIAKIAGIATSNPLLIQDEKVALLSWLVDIGETNAEAIARVIRRCQEDMAIRDYFLRVAMAHKTANTDFDDDRRYCHQCASLSPTGHCMAAWRGEIKASRNYRRIGDLRLRCKGYQPKADDPDQRQASDRWPGLLTKKRGDYA